MGQTISGRANKKTGRKQGRKGSGNSSESPGVLLPPIPQATRIQSSNLTPGSQHGKSRKYSHISPTVAQSKALAASQGLERSSLNNICQPGQFQMSSALNEKARSPLSNIINMEGGSGDNAEADDKDTAVKETIDQPPKRTVDFEQKNLDRLEALKAQKAMEKKENEEAREKMKRRQEKLKNMILKEAEENRAKKAAEK